MNKKRALGILGVLAVCVVILIAGRIFSREKAIHIMDQRENEMAKVIYEDGAWKYECEEGYESYVDIVLEEAEELIAAQQGIETEDAEQFLIQNEISITTFFDQEAYQSLKEAHDGCREILGYEFAAAISDTKGRLTACYSDGRESGTQNYVVTPTYAGSTIKPLSVYGPGIEARKICWSSMYEDSAYTQLEDEDGELADWPVNTKDYTYEMKTVEEAVKESNNAIAVKVLKDCGVKESCEFLGRRLHMNVEPETRELEEDGEDSILSNIALGYLEEGVTMKEMLEDYQVFANGGIRYPLHAIATMETGEETYEWAEDAGEQVFTPETAYIMNRLLERVVDSGGTGENAGAEGLDICGKTGTSRNYQDNWFIGMTPEYVCAVWYELEDAGLYLRNESPGIFREIMSGIGHDKEALYPVPENVEEAEYCKKTGLIANEHCAETGTGYYRADDLPPVCHCE